MDNMMKARERFVSEFEQLYSKVAPEDKIQKDCIEIMKDLLKCIYYIDAIEGMASGFDDEDDGYSRNYPASRGYSNGGYYGRSYDGGYSGRRRNSMGRFSRNSARSYEDEKRNAMNRLHEMMNNEPNEEVRMAIQSVMRELGD